MEKFNQDHGCKNLTSIQVSVIFIAKKGEFSSHNRMFIPKPISN